MEPMNRREFLQISSRLAALMGLTGSAAGALADAVKQLAAGTAPVLWLQGQSCSGCSVSLLNSHPLSPAELLTRYISLSFHQTLSTATGEMAAGAVEASIQAGGYVLVVEGSVPAGMPEACQFHHEPFAAQLERAAKAANCVVAVGTCSAFGGIPAAENNPTGAVSVPKFLAQAGVNKPVVTIPGCPAHPDWIVGTLAHVLKFGLPALDELGRPKAFFSRLVHDQCPRFADYERERFASAPGEEGCLFKLGCAGPLTKADCSLRLWNSGTNFCINAGAPCIGCANPDFCRDAGFALYWRPAAQTAEARS